MNSIIISIAKYTALETFHNRLLWLIFGGALAGVSIGIFGSALAITESQQIQTAFMSASLRIFAVFIVCLVVVNSISRELNDKSLDMLLSLAITRSAYYFGKLAGFCVVILFLSVSFGLCLLISADLNQIIIWSVSLFLELFLVLCFSFLCALSLRQVPISVIVVIAFYFLSRSINAVTLMINAPLLSADSMANSVMTYTFQAVAYLTPDLSIFTRSDWLIYGTGEWASLQNIFLQTLSYFILLAGASLIDFYRKSI